VDGVPQEVKDQIRLDDPLEAPTLTPHTAYEAFEHVLASAGARVPRRDAIDTRIIREALTRTAAFGGTYGDARGIIDSQEMVGGWVILESTSPPDDTDHDGMSDEWEDQMGLDKNNPDDRNGDLNGNGYTNLEDYLNGLVEEAEFMVRPIHFQVDTIIGYEVTLSWEDISDNESGFIIERKEGDSWNELASLPAEATTYTDLSLAANGSYFYRIKAFNDVLESFYTDSATAQLTVGLEDHLAEKMSLHIYPNPITELATLKYTVRQLSDVELSVVDLTGRMVLSLDAGERAAGEYVILLPGNRLESGAYLILFRAGGSILMKKILITR
jgi:hypothetical protein